MELIAQHIPDRQLCNATNFQGEEYYFITRFGRQNNGHAHLCIPLTQYRYASLLQLCLSYMTVTCNNCRGGNLSWGGGGGLQSPPLCYKVWKEGNTCCKKNNQGRGVFREVEGGIHPPLKIPLPPLPPSLTSRWLKSRLKIHKQGLSQKKSAKLIWIKNSFYICGLKSAIINLKKQHKPCSPTDFFKNETKKHATSCTMMPAKVKLKI